MQINSKNLNFIAAYRMACKDDLEGIVAKQKCSSYLQDHAEWLKICNRDYSQWVGREELLERERDTSPDFDLWDACANRLRGSSGLGTTYVVS
jgi:hypothetical protein